MDAAERNLVERARAGELDAFSQLVERHWAMLVRFARSIIGEVDAEDCVQDGFVAAWSKLAGLKEPDAFPAWILRIVTRRCLSRLRVRSRWLSLGARQHNRELARPADEGSVQVDRILAHLAPRQRAVMHLTVIEGMTDGEIAAILRIRTASVRAHRRRAKRSLQRLLRAGSQAEGVTNGTWIGTKKRPAGPEEDCPRR